MVALETIVSLCKRRGFIFPGSEIYGGLSGTWDYGPLGAALKDNIKRLWWRRFVTSRDDMFGVDAAILMRREVWQASGHTQDFSDPMVECRRCKRLFRADQTEVSKCPECGGQFEEKKQFNMMFKTHAGAEENPESLSYLRPETAQGMFVNFKNIIDSFHPRLPFGLAQIGKAFRNEIAPRDFLFRTREFEQMEIEYFVRPGEWREHFERFRAEMNEWIARDLGLDGAKVCEREVPDDERAHYSRRTIDFEFDFPIGRKELYGLAYRTDFDLARHSERSGADFGWRDEKTDEFFIPHCIEPSFGLDRTVLALLCDAYREDEMAGEKRVYLKFSPTVAPIKAAVFPLLKNKPPLVEKARHVYGMLKGEFGDIMFDDDGNIGKRYRRQDEVGTPFCVTIDFETLDNDTVTVRARDSGKQERVLQADLIGFLRSRFK